MTIPAFWNEVWTAALVNHLWQSTAVFLIAFPLTHALQRNQARTRYWIWFIASIKFFVPFSLLVSVGESLRAMFSVPVQRTTLASAMEQITQPFPASATTAPVPFADFIAAPAVAPHNSNPVALIFVAVWLCGFFTVVISWIRGWRKARTAVRTARSMALVADVQVLSSSDVPEPCVFGIVRPLLLLPQGITERLTSTQLGTIIAHEMCHVRRRDNLTIAIHMIVEATFWFHPAVWWIKARLLEERERACDEAVLQSGNNADLYAESILNVCRFYAERPLACAAGVTGSNLKRRIVRIMTEQVTHKLHFTQKVLLTVAGTIALAIPLIFGLIRVDKAHAQTTAESQSQGIVGNWQGTLNVGKELRLVVKIVQDDKDTYKATLYSIDQGGMGIPADATTLQGGMFKMSVKAIGGSYEGKLSPDGKSIAGTWTQGSPLALNLARTTPETEWAIPEKPPLPPMDANASPSFEVVTIKPSNPDDQRKGIIVGPDGLLKAFNNSLADLISFTYGVQQKQLVGASGWMATEKYDVVGKPDGQGAPSDKQWKEMLQKMLADRFQLKFHHDRKELSVYVLGVAKSGPKLTKSGADPNSLPALFFRGYGQLVVRNATIGDFSGLILQGSVLDRPVLDQTGISEKYDFTLDWMPDDSQFPMFGGKLPPAPEGFSAPNLYTALQEQLGLKLEATKAPADVLVIDHVEKPSAN